jgi:hypothetical protein
LTKKIKGKNKIKESPWLSVRHLGIICGSPHCDFYEKKQGREKRGLRRERNNNLFLKSR